MTVNKLKRRWMTHTHLLQDMIDKVHRRNFRMIYYHMVREQHVPYYFPTHISPGVFREQIRFLKNKYEIVSLPEAMARARQGDPLHRVLTITTDDGFVENYDFIAPILVEENVTATFYLISGCLDNKELMWRNKLLLVQNKTERTQVQRLMQRLAVEFNLIEPLPSDSLLSWSYRDWDMREKDFLANRIWEWSGMIPLAEWLGKHQPYLTTQHIQQLGNSGFHFGAHTRTHPFCSRLSYEQLVDEVIGSMNELKEKTGQAIHTVTYPFGNRAEPALEQQLIADYKDQLTGLFGIQNTLCNRNNAYEWERDPMEQPFEPSIFRFVLAPLKRRSRQMLRAFAASVRP